MRRAILFCAVLVLCLDLFSADGKALTASANPGSSLDLQVVYLQDGANLTTYNINTDTLTASQAGDPFALPIASFNFLASSLNGKFLYILGNDTSNNQDIWVFATDYNGEPHGPPIQIIKANGLYNFSLDPVFNFAYGVLGSLNSQAQSVYKILSFAVDPTTGILSPPIIAAAYPVNGPCPPGVLGAYPNLDGFSTDGKTLYDDWYCNYPASTTAIYNERRLKPQSGALGRDVEVFTWSDGTQGFDTVSFSHDHIIDYHSPNGNDTGNNLDIYPVVPNSTQPMIQCTASMLAICGSAIGAIIDPSGKYIFFVNSSFGDNIVQIDIASHRLVDTGQSLPAQVAKFNPEGTIAYTLNISGTSYYLEIYGFDPFTGEITTNGGEISAPSITDTFWPVARK
jgi:hypothetical protein